MKPLVSIAIITYNQREFIHETLLSALKQDYENLEVIVADDGSQDGTQEVIMEYANKYRGKLIPILNKSNLGITKNSNNALKACKGKYIAFQGGDDILLPAKIRKQVEWLEEDHNRVLCGHDVEAFDSKTDKTLYIWSRRFSLPEGVGAKRIIEKGVPFCATSIMVRTAAIPEHGFDERIPISSDWKFWIDCLANGGAFGSISGIYARYRIHENNITKVKNIKLISDMFVTLALIETAYPNYIKSCQKGRARKYYSRGIDLLDENKKNDARKYFTNAIKCHKFMTPKIYIWIILSLLPNKLYKRVYKLIVRL